MSRIISAREGDCWKSSIFVSNQDQTQHIAFHRAGVLNGVVLELMLFFRNEGGGDVIKVLTFEEKNVSGQMSGLMVNESLGEEMILIFEEVSKTLAIFGEKEESFSFLLMDPPKDSKIFRPTKN